MGNDLEEVTCNLCQSNDYGKLYTLKDKNFVFFVVKCKRCGLVYLNPRLKQDALKNVYAEDSLSNFNYYFQNKNLDEKTFAARLNSLERYSAKKGSILDIGSSIGTFMSVAKKLGYEPYGIELNEKSANYSKKQGFKLFLDLDKIKQKFNFVNLSDVLEHLPNPQNTLKKIWNLLEDEGIILISTSYML